MSLSPGTLLAPYEIVSTLGAGGMGEVYRARDPRLDRFVAIKLVATHSSGAAAQQRIRLEARAISQLQHPNICSLYDIGVYQDETFLVMELLEGETLDHRLLRGAVPFSQVLGIAIEIASALDYAHSKGIIHRDIKPSNIFLTPQAGAKLMDFGLMKQAFDVDASPDKVTIADSRLTSPGIALGTVAYMSPEQARAEDVDNRSDLFSFGAVLYEAATGRPAFPGSTSAVIFDAILNRAPAPPVALKPELPQSFADIVNKLLDKERDLRYQSAAELRTDLKRLRRELEGYSSGRIDASTAQPASSSRVRGNWTYLAAVAGLILLSVMWWLRHSREKSFSQSGNVEIVALTSTGNAVRGAASPDGRYIAYVNLDSGKRDLRLLQVATGRDVVIIPASAERFETLLFSPDGNFIYFTRQPDAGNQSRTCLFQRIATLGGPPTTISERAKCGPIAVSPNGEQVAYVTFVSPNAPNEQLVVSNSDNSNHKIMAEPVFFGYLAWSPHADTLAASVYEGNKITLATVSLADGSIRPVNQELWVRLGQPAWSGDSKIIFIPGLLRNSLFSPVWAIDADTGQKQAITTGERAYGDSLAATANGNLVTESYYRVSAVWVTDPAGNDARKIGASTGEGSNGVAWVGDKIVASDGKTIVVRDTNGNDPGTFTITAWYLNKCGSSGAVYSTPDDKLNVYIALLDPVRGTAQRLTNGPNDMYPSCSPDGSTLVFEHCTLDGKCFGAMKHVGSAELLPLTPERLTPWSASFSPDGQNLASIAPDPATKHMVLSLTPSRSLTASALQTARTVKLPMSGDQLGDWSWAADSKSLLYAPPGQNDVQNIWTIPLNGRPPRQLTHFDFDDILSWDTAADGRLALARGKEMNDVVMIRNVK